MRSGQALRIGVFACAALLYGCGGAGGGVRAPEPAAAQGTVPQASGIIAATGPLTVLGGGSAIGSTILAGSTAAVFTIDSGSTPREVTTGDLLRTYPITIAETAGPMLSSSARSGLQRLAAETRRDPDVRIPDSPLAARLTRRLLELQREPSGISRSTAQLRRTRAFVAGDRRTFEIQAGTINGAAVDPIPMPATLVAQSSHANVWLDDAVYRDAALLAREFPSGASDFVAVARTFETTFAIETQAFGPAYTTGIVNFAQCGANGTLLADAAPRPDTTGTADPHINIVITDQLKDSGEGGYFYGLDMLDQSEANCVAGMPKPKVNGLPMLVIESDNYVPHSGAAADTYPASNETYWLQGDMPQTVAHEFQHYLHFVNKYLQQHVDHPDDPNAGTLDDSYIDEGCSVLAQDLVAGAAVANRESPLFVRAFLLEPADFSLTSFTGYQPNALDSAGAVPPYGYYRNTAGNYGFAYLFVRYLYDRFGPGAIKAIYAQTGTAGGSGANTGPATAAARGEPLAQLFREFTTAIAVHSGGSVPEVSTDPASRFDASVILRGSVQTYSRRLPPYSLRTIVQPGPLDPQIFANNIPTGTIDLRPGTTVTATLLDGGALFVTPHGPWPLGAALRATGTITGGGSLGQGQMPTPAPAYN